jgi:dTDP-glucose pyrophosphorylase
MKVLIPMAGAGSRFKEAGYTVSKPGINVDGLPMVVQAAKALPQGDEYIFICRDFHLDEGLDTTIANHLPHSRFIPVDKLTEGQASTCLLAKEYINNDTPLMIGACDNAMIWNKEAFHTLSSTADCIVWTFRNSIAVVEKPEQYGWIKVEHDNTVTGTSIKKAISDTPKRDHAVVGSFWFRKGSDFVAAAEEMIAENDRINGEFYVDKCIDYILKAGKTVKVFEVDYYIGWGTPADLDTWTYWSGFLKEHPECLK